jgi:hypothetical protein
MKKICILVAILFQLFNIGSSLAQCYTATYGLYPSATFTPTCSGAFQDITTLGYAGEYSNVNLVAGNTYTFRSSITTDYITVDNNGVAPLVGVVGVSSANGITWTCALTGTYRFYTHTNSACGSSALNRTRSISCSVVPAYNPCTTIPTLTCGVTTAYSMAASAGAWSSYGGLFATPGRENLFAFTPLTTGLHNVTVNASSGWVDLFLKPQSSGCNSAGWTYVNDIFGTETQGINLTAGVAYYIMLDDEDQTANTGSISVSCPSPSAPPSSPISISPNVTNINCAGQSATLTVNGNVGTTYWFLNSCGNSIASSVGSGNSIVVSPAVTSTYYARNYNGQWSVNCAQSATVNVNASPSQPLNPTSNSPQCASVTITRSGNPPAGVTWYWQGTNPNGTATNLGSGTTYIANSSGTYYLRALNSSGCWSAQSASINVLIDAVPATPGVLSSNSPQCNAVTITRSGNPTAGITWYWQGTNANGTATNLGFGINYTCPSSGTYYLRARNSSGCWSASSSSISVVVNQSPSQPSNPVSNSPQCNAVILTWLGNPPAGETWYWQGTNPNGISTILGSGVNFTATSTGTYYLRSMTSANCWSNSSASISVVVYSLPSVPATPSSNSPQCASVTISRSGNPPAGATWYWQGTNPNGTLTNLGAGPTYTANASGTYYIRALNNNNCWSSSSASTAVTVFTTNTGVQSVVACDSFTWVNGVTYTNSTNSPSMLLPNASVFGCDSNLVLNLTVHPTFNTAVTVVSCDTYTWIDGITYNASTSNPSYMLTSQYGCDSTVHLNLTIGYPQFDTTFHNATCIGSYLLNGIEYTQSGIYYQLLQDQFGCDSTVQLNLIVEDAALDETSNASLLAFPNPSQDGLFELQSSKNIEIMEVLDVSGRAVPFQVEGTQLLLNQNSGVYLCILKYENSTIAIRLVITP